MALAAVAVVVFSLLAYGRGSLQRARGDEATYLAMTASLARDGDLLFTEEDKKRLADGDLPGAGTVILQRTARGISYSKPVLPSLLAAPVTVVVGDLGLVGVNALALCAAFWLLYGYLRRLGPRGRALLTLVTFAAAGVLLPYLLWRTSDVLQASLALVGTVLIVGNLGKNEEGAQSVLDRSWSPWLGALLLGLLISLRPPNLILALAPLAAVALQRSWRRALALSLVVLIAVIAVGGASWALYGTSMPYKAERATFNEQTGYPAGDDAATAAEQFARDRATSSLGVRPDFKPRVSAFAALYFVFGRHTGLLWYFPAAIFLVGTALRWRSRTGVVILAAVAATALFFILWLPFNYFGGGGSIGNRYFLASYAILPLALRRLPGTRTIALTWLAAAIVGGSALASVYGTRGMSGTTQSHAHAGLFRLFPYESTASDLDGSRDSYYGDGREFMRTVDPYTDRAAWSLLLHSDRPPAEIEVANLLREDRLRFLVHSSADDLELVYRDRGREVVVPLSRPVGRSGLVEIDPSPPWRYHPLWFRNAWDHGEPYYLRVFRLGIRTAGGAPATARVRFLAKAQFPPRVFAARSVDLELPNEVLAGTEERIEVQVRNESAALWRRRGLLPVVLSYRLKSPGGEVFEGARVELPHGVGPGRQVSVPLAVRWPDAPGAYELTVDLLVEGVAWFEQETGTPLARERVRVHDEDEAVDRG